MKKILFVMAFCLTPLFGFTTRCAAEESATAEAEKYEALFEKGLKTLSLDSYVSAFIDSRLDEGSETMTVRIFSSDPDLQAVKNNAKEFGYNFGKMPRDLKIDDGREGGIRVLSESEVTDECRLFLRAVQGGACYEVILYLKKR